MSDHPPHRVRVTGPPRRRTSLNRAADIDASTPLGEVYVGSLLRAQLGLAGRVLLLLALALGTMPAVFHLVPSLADLRLLGIPLAWLLLGVLAYPFLVLVGWRYIRRAEANEAAFAELLTRRAEPPERTS